jgi:hypothetical protein
MSTLPKNSAIHRDCLFMSKNPLDVLKKGLSKLKNSIKERNDNLLAFLNRKEKISDEDKEWLDNAGNMVDEEAVVDFLENVSDYECGLTSSLDQLEAHGILLQKNQMNLDSEELLNPISLISEQEVIVGKVPEEKIFRSVQDMAVAEQMMEVNGGDDIDEETVQVKPTRKEALTAAFTLQKYYADINEPFARKLEDSLASYGHQTRMKGNRMMEATHITDYFTHK